MIKLKKFCSSLLFLYRKDSCIAETNSTFSIYGRTALEGWIDYLLRTSENILELVMLLMNLFPLPVSAATDDYILLSTSLLIFILSSEGTIYP
jgi:hypothetical protein